MMSTRATSASPGLASWITAPTCSAAACATLFQVARVHALGIERLSVMRHLVIGVLQRGAQALQLQRGNLVAAGAFNRLQIAGGGAFRGHDGFLGFQAATAGLPFKV